MGKTLKTIMSPLASLRLTVVLMALLLVLIFAGTWAQIDRGIFTVMSQYFRSFYVFIPFRIFAPRDWNVLGGIPFPGGYTLGMLLLTNLLSAHAVRFKVKARNVRLVMGTCILLAGGGVIYAFHHSDLPADILAWGGGYNGVLPLMAVGALFYAPFVGGAILVFGRRCGIMLIHLALLLLLAGEGITASTALETQMPIYEGQTLHWSHDVREVELAVIDHSQPDHDLVVVIPEQRLLDAFASEQAIQHDDLPFDVTVEQYMINSDLIELARFPEVQPQASAGVGLRYVLQPIAEASGVGDQMTNFPGAIISLQRDGTDLGRYIVSSQLMSSFNQFIGQDVQVADKTYSIYLRRKRYYKPYAITLIDFKHDLYPGTTVPLNYSSDVRLISARYNEDRPVKIYMNNPLRYRGETFFQASFMPGDQGTILQVVKNPGWRVPYIACVLGALGLLIHFNMLLVRFLLRSKA